LRDVAGAVGGGQGGVAPAAGGSTRNEMNPPYVTPMPLARRAEPFDDPDWIFEAFLRMQRK
jgi:hypothetical protein